MTRRTITLRTLYIYQREYDNGMVQYRMYFKQLGDWLVMPSDFASLILKKRLWSTTVTCITLNLLLLFLATSDTLVVHYHARNMYIYVNYAIFHKDTKKQLLILKSSHRARDHKPSLTCTCTCMHVYIKVVCVNEHYVFKFSCLIFFQRVLKQNHWTKLQACTILKWYPVGKARIW